MSPGLSPAQGRGEQRPGAGRGVPRPAGRRKPFLLPGRAFPRIAIGPADRVRLDGSLSPGRRGAGLSGLRALAQLPARTLSAWRNRGCGPVGDEGRRADLCLATGQAHHHHDERAADPRARPGGSGQDPRRDGAGARGGRVRRRPAGLFRTCPHRAGFLLFQAERHHRPLRTHRAEGLGTDARTFLAASACRIRVAATAGAGGPAGHGLLSGRAAGCLRARRPVTSTWPC